MELSYFTSLSQAVECAVAEINRSLAEDIDRLSWADGAEFTPDERRAELARLKELRAVLPLMAAAPLLLTALKSAFRSLSYISDAVLSDDERLVSALEYDEIERIYRDAISNLGGIKMAIEQATEQLERKGPSPIALAKAATPFWFETIQSYDGLEIAPVAEYEGKDGCKFCERVDDPEEAQFWSVYGHMPVGGVECLEDFPTEQEAMAFASRLLEMYPNLQKHWLIRA